MKFILLPTAKNNRIFNAGLLQPGNLVKISDYKLVTNETDLKHPNDTYVLVGKMQNLPNQSLVLNSPICWHDGVPERIRTWDVPLLNCGRSFYLPATNTDLLYGKVSPYLSLPRWTPAGGTENGAWHDLPRLPTIVATSDEKRNTKNTDGNNQKQYDQVILDPSAILQCSTLVDAIANRQKCPRLKTKHGIVTSELDMKNAICGRIVRKGRLIHYGKIHEKQKRVCPYLFKFEIVDSSLMGSGSGRTLVVTCWDHLCPKLYHRLIVGSVVCIWGYRWNEYKDKLEIKLNAGQSTVLTVDYGKYEDTGNDNIVYSSGDEEEVGEEEEEEEEGGGDVEAVTRSSRRRKRNAKKSFQSGQRKKKRKSIDQDDHPALKYIRQRYPRPLMKLVETNDLHLLPHRERFDFVGMLTYIGSTRRTRQKKRVMGGGSGNLLDLGEEEQLTTILYDTDTGRLKDTNVDAHFSEWAWLLLRDCSSRNQLAIKLFTNSRPGGLERLKQHMNQVICFTDLIMMTNVDKGGIGQHSMFARSTDMTDTIVIPQGNSIFPKNYNTKYNFWWGRNGNVIRSHEEIAMKMSMEAKNIFQHTAQLHLKKVHQRWAVDATPYFYGYERSSFFSKSASYPFIKLPDLHSLCESLHFREYRVLSCRGTITNIEIKTDPSLHDQWELYTELSENTSENGDMLREILVQTADSMLVTMKCAPDSDFFDPASRPVFEVLQMQPFEGMPSSVPNSLYQHAKKKRLERFGGVSSLTDAIASCFTCGKDDDDEVS